VYDHRVASLTRVEATLGEVIGLAQSAQPTAGRVLEALGGGEAGLSSNLRQITSQAAELESAARTVADGFPGKKTAIQATARRVRTMADDLRERSFSEQANPLAALEFLVMAEAAEVAHWTALQALNEQLGDQKIRELAAWALPQEQQHLEDAFAAVKQLASQTDPASAASAS
jgi:ferritin-like metal-binding protein YciE